MLAYTYSDHSWKATMKRTTIMADDELLLEARHLADRENKTLSALIQEALREYIAGHRPERRISFVGIGESTGPAVSVEEQDQLLRDGLDPIEGWSPDRSGLCHSNESPANHEAPSRS